MNNKFVHLEKLINNNQFTVRFQQNEKKPERTGSMIFSPIVTNESFGFGFESKTESAFSLENIEKIKIMSEHVQAVYKIVLEREITAQKSINDSANILYSATSLYNFFQIFSSIYNRYQQEFYILHISIHKSSLAQNSQNVLYRFVANELKKISRPSDMLFKINDQTVVALIGQTDSKSLSDIKNRYTEAINKTRLIIESRSIEPRISIKVIDKAHKKSYEDFMTSLNAISVNL